MKVVDRRDYYTRLFPVGYLRRLFMTPLYSITLSGDQYILNQSDLGRIPELAREHDIVRLDIQGLGPAEDVYARTLGLKAGSGNPLKFDFDITDFPNRCSQNCQCCARCWERYVQPLVADVIFRCKELTQLTPLLFQSERGFHGWIPEAYMSHFPNSLRQRFYQDLTLSLGAVPIFDKGVTTNRDHSLRMVMSIHQSGRLITPMYDEHQPRWEGLELKGDALDAFVEARVLDGKRALVRLEEERRTMMTIGAE